MFALNRRTAWGAAAIEASAWDFDVSNLTYEGAIVLPNILASNNFLTSLKFVDGGAAVVYSNLYSFYKLLLPTPYDIMSSDLSVAASSANIFQSGVSTGMFSTDGRAFHAFENVSGSNNFRRLPLDIAFDPFDKTSSDLISLTPSHAVTGSRFAEYSADGLYFFTLSNVNSQGMLYQYTRAEPFEPSTLSLATVSVSLTSLLPSGANNNGFTAFAFSPDGLRLLTVGGLGSTSGRVIRMWALQEPWNIMRVSHVGAAAFDTNQANGGNFVTVDPTVTKLYVYATASSPRLVQYAINKS